MITALLSLMTQSVPVSMNALKSEAIREQRRFLLPFSKKGREKQRYSMRSIENMQNERDCIKVIL